MASILNGIDSLVDKTLDLAEVGKGSPHYGHRESWLRIMHREGAAAQWRTLIPDLASLIEGNWDWKESRGRQNWRHTQECKIADKNLSLEKCIEKGVANLGDSSWGNQVPICSGVNDGRDGKRSVDLANLSGSDLELIELKVDSNTPLYATVEVLVYGLVYRFSRRHRDALGYSPQSNPLLFAPHRVALKVLAPKAYYGDAAAALRGIEDGVTAALSGLPNEGYGMTFGFECFAEPPRSRDEITPSYCRDVILKRSPVVAR
jgi:hypothetical protein